jgi:membrane-bound lytic murein transglycosylase D
VEKFIMSFIKNFILSLVLTTINYSTGAQSSEVQERNALWHFSLPDVDQSSSINDKEKKTTSSSDLKPLTSGHIDAAMNPEVVSLVAPTSLWVRLRSGFGMTNISDARVTANEKWYSSRKDYIIRMVERSKASLFHVVEALEKRNMPTEIALLPFIESAYNPMAVSSAHAVGIWQFMPETGRTFDLVQNAFRDDRRNILTSTSAALDYLQKLYKMFGSWPLALAAYNWGEGSVSRAILKNEKKGLPTDYSHLELPAETRDYVPKLQAVKNIVADPNAFNSILPNIGNHPYFETVVIKHDMDVAMIAKLADISIQEFKSLNPYLNRPVVLAEGDPTILLPWENGKTFKENLQAHGNNNLSSWTVWVNPSTLSSSEIAYRFNMNEAEFREINQIKPHMLVKAGSALLVPRNRFSESNVAQKVADSGQVSVMPKHSSRLIYVKARHGDTSEKIARRYHLAPSSVAQWNHLTEHEKILAGRRLAIRVPIRVVARDLKKDTKINNKHSSDGRDYREKIINKKFSEKSKHEELKKHRIRVVHRQNNWAMYEKNKLRSE